MKKTILEKVADNKFNAVKQLVRFIRENDKFLVCKGHGAVFIATDFQELLDFKESAKIKHRPQRDATILNNQFFSMHIIQPFSAQQSDTMSGGSHQAA